MESMVINLLTAHKNESIMFITQHTNVIQKLQETKVTKKEIELLLNKLGNEIKSLLQKQNNEMQQTIEPYGWMFNNILPTWLNEIKSQIIHD